MEVNLDAAGTPAVLHVDETDHLGKWIAKRGWYEKDLLDDAAQRVHGPGTALDVGAHIGNHSLWFALAMGLKIVAIEPNAQTLQRLKRNIRANRGARIKTVHAAVDRARGRGTSIPGPDGNTGMATVAFDGIGDVKVISLDSLRVRNVKLIKVDVEGTGPQVLLGGRQLIERDSPVIYVEADDPDEIVAVLPDGYEEFGKFAFTPTYGFARRSR